MTEIIVDSSNNNYEIDGHKLNKFNNVESYQHRDRDGVGKLTITVSKDQSNIPKNYYFVFDSQGTDAFGHWIYESFIFYPILNKLLQIYPNIKILTTNQKKYVKTFFLFFNINCEIIHKINDIDNICFFPPVLSINDKLIDETIYCQYIKNFIDDIQMKIIISPLNNILLLPRNTIDNYKHNDRIIPKIDEIINNIIEL